MTVGLLTAIRSVRLAFGVRMDIGAISITGLKLNQPAKFYRSLGQLVATHATAISHALGFVDISR